MIYRLKYAKSESNFDADFEHPTLQGALLTVIIPRALPWAKGFCPFRACCLYGLLPLLGVLLVWASALTGGVMLLKLTSSVLYS